MMLDMLNTVGLPAAPGVPIIKTLAQFQWNERVSLLVEEAGKIADVLQYPNREYVLVHNDKLSNAGVAARALDFMVKSIESDTPPTIEQLATYLEAYRNILPMDDQQPIRQSDVMKANILRVAEFLKPKLDWRGLYFVTRKKNYNRSLILCFSLLHFIHSHR